MINREVELIAAERAILGEGPCWDQVNNRLYWIDGFGCKVFIYNPENGENRAIDVGKYVGCVAPVKSGGLVVSLQDGFYFLDPNTEKLILLANPERGIKENRFNDGKIDCMGRFWSGSMSMNENGGKCDFEPTGALYRMDQDLSIVKVLDHVTLSNGLTWSPDNAIFYFIDTPTMRIDAFDFDRVSGNLSNRRKVIDFPENEGVPDGMTVDHDGMLWIGHYGGGRVSRWNPVSGQKLDEIMVPTLNATCCTFGGPDNKDLYITTACAGMTQEEMIQFPEAGGLFRVHLDVKGIPGNYFSGQFFFGEGYGKTL